MTNPSPPPDPKDLLREAESLRAQALGIEREALRIALEASDWLVKPAARMLGLPRHTSLIRMLTGRHRPLFEELEKRREAKSYSTGNPSPMRNK